jgi:hypothetical protein
LARPSSRLLEWTAPRNARHPAHGALGPISLGVPGQDRATPMDNITVSKQKVSENAPSRLIARNLPVAFAAGVDPERDDLCLAGRLRAAGMVARDALCETAVSRVLGQWLCLPAGRP